MSENNIFLDLFIHRMNVRDSQGGERSRTKIKGEIRKNGKQFLTVRSAFLPERDEWNKLRSTYKKAGLEECKYEEKIDQILDLSLFRRLEAIHVPQKKVPPLRQLSKLIRQKRSPDNQKRLVRRMEKAWQEASEDLVLRSTRKLPPRLRNWEDEESFPLGHTKADAARLLGVDRKTIYNWIDKETIKKTSKGRISISEIQRLRRGDAPVVE